MAAVLARGATVIENAAMEPEIVALAEFLVKMGAKINGIGTAKLKIEGVDELHPCDELMIPDRIEAGTLLAAAAITGGSVRLTNCNPAHLDAILSKFVDAGAKIKTGLAWVELKAPARLKAVDVTTEIYPGFPTDMQAQWISLMAKARGSAIVTDTVYFDRFKHVPELVRLGADIEIRQN